MLETLMTDQDLRKEVWPEAFDAGTQKQYARKTGVHGAVLSGFISGAREPSKHLLDAMGYEKVAAVRYRKQKVTA